MKEQQGGGHTSLPSKRADFTRLRERATYCIWGLRHQLSLPFTWAQPNNLFIEKTTPTPPDAALNYNHPASHGSPGRSPAQSKPRYRTTFCRLLRVGRDWFINADPNKMGLLWVVTSLGQWPAHKFKGEKLIRLYRALGTPLDWPEAKKNADHVRRWGVKV